MTDIQQEYILLLIIEVKMAFLHILKNRLGNKIKRLEMSDYIIEYTLSWIEEYH